LEVSVGFHGMKRKRQRTAALHAAAAPANAPDIAKRLGVRLSSAAFPRSASYCHQALDQRSPMQSKPGRTAEYAEYAESGYWLRL